LLDLFLVDMGGSLIERTGMTDALRGLGLIIPSMENNPAVLTARFVSGTENPCCQICAYML